MSDEPGRRPPNRLANETSPYLRQHRFNPVDWHPWGEEALARAREEDKPIFLSIGYSSCHWCHVMERESFENDEIAALLNAHFVSIKVDREERPDLDEVYMKAVQLLTGQGGWPMSVFLTPDLKPYYGGTYFPPTDRWGRPGFATVLSYLARAYAEDRERVVRSADGISARIAELAAGRAASEEIAPELLDVAVTMLDRLFDERDGGFGDPPKFPHPMDIALLLRRNARGPNARVLQIAGFSLEKMARGGIYDQIGGGFHRYSTDGEWLIPHFEKMLYDNALLAPVYAEAFAVTGEPTFERVARETCAYVIREMTHPDGGFYSATDADSEGVEGKYFVWTPDEIRDVLGRADGDAFCSYFGVSASGNFEHGTSALTQKGDESRRATFASAIARLLERRRTRVAPGLDDKVLTEWNGLMISGLVRTGAILDEPRFVAAAERAAAFLLGAAWNGGRLLRTWREGEARIDAFLPDYANLAQALFDLASVSSDPRWLDAAIRLTGAALDRFAAPDGGFFMTAADQEAPLGRSRDPFDNAVPSGNSVMAMNLLRAHEVTGDAGYEAAARATMQSFAALVRQSPAGFGQMLQAIDVAIYHPRTVLLVGRPGADDLRALERAAHGRLRPGSFVLASDGGRANDPTAPGILRHRDAVGGRATAYVCAGGTCLSPIQDAPALAAALDA